MTDSLIDEAQSKRYIAYMNKLHKKKRVYSKFVLDYAQTFESIKTREEEIRLLHALQDAEDWGKEIE